MATITIIEKTNNSAEPIKYGSRLVIDSEKLIGISTKSLYVRKGFKNGTLFLSRKGHGGYGAGDICKINDNAHYIYNSDPYEKGVGYVH